MQRSYFQPSLSFFPCQGPGAEAPDPHSKKRPHWEVPRKGRSPKGDIGMILYFTYRAIEEDIFFCSSQFLTFLCAFVSGVSVRSLPAQLFS